LNVTLIDNVKDVLL